MDYSGFHIGIIIGLVIGIGIGISIGIAMGNKQKPWSEMDDREKKVRIGTITAGCILLIAGIVQFILRINQ